jgi:hypothetical protein
MVAQPSGRPPAEDPHRPRELPARREADVPADEAPPDPLDQEPDPLDQEWESCSWFYDDDEAEESSYLASLPPDVRQAYLAGPWTGAGEGIAAGFLHHQADEIRGLGFAAGGHLDQLVPGPELAAHAADASRRGAELGESELIGVLCGWQRLTSWAQAGQAAALNTLVARRKEQAVTLKRPALAGHVDDEAAAALSLTGRTASRLLDIAGGLAHLPQVLAALSAGRIDWTKAALFTDHLAGLPDAAANDIAAAVLATADHKTSGQLRNALIRAVLAYDPESAQRRRKEARQDTCVQLWPESSGNSGLAGRELDPADALCADARLSEYARWLHDHGADGSMDELRAAAMIALLSGRSLDALIPVAGDFRGRDNSAEGPAAGRAGNNASSDDAGATPLGTAGTCGAPDGTCGAPAGTCGAPAGTCGAPAAEALGLAAVPLLTGTINLTLPMSAWLGLSALPGELAGYGATDGATCRDLAARNNAATRWCLTLTGREGRAIAHACATSAPPRAGPALVTWAAGLRPRLRYLQTGTCDHTRQSGSYRPSSSLRHLICIRQRTCAFPGCRRPARRTDLDHTIPFDQGGRTCECNLAPLCRRHHQAKQAPGWSLTQDEPGIMTWELPHGRRYVTTPEPYLA